MPIKEERTVAADFGERYRRSATEATRDLERSVIGGDFGANGYTTLAQADMLADRLALSEADRLLDVGSGRGGQASISPGGRVARWCSPIFLPRPWPRPASGPGRRG